MNSEALMEWDFARLWMRGIKLVLSLLILTILAALTGGVVKTFLDTRLLLDSPVEVALRQIIVDTLLLLALVEVFKTTVTYFSEGRVKVTFIVDTILVVMLTEVISQWFKGGNLGQLGVLGAILLTLGVMRVLAVRCSPPCRRPRTGGWWHDVPVLRGSQGHRNDPAMLRSRGAL
jgi:uncharacterized membrane protein (DUF373 family)